jgi:aminoglycoside phosphotransferase (APT) family kinase protein
MKHEILHDLSSFPSSIHLLQAARAALNDGLAPCAVGPSSLGALRQVNAILRELMHRAFDLEPLLAKQSRSGQRLIDEARALGAQFKGVNIKRSPAGRKGAPSRYARHTQISLQLCAIVPVLWTAWSRKRSPAVERRLLALTRKVIAWEEKLAAALGKEIPNLGQARRVKASILPAAGDVQSYLRASRFGPADLRVTSLDRLSGGFSRATWMLQTRSDESGELPLIVRQQLKGGIVEGIAADIRHEYPLLRVLSSEGLPVPKPLHLARGTNPFGGDFMIVNKLAGRTIGTTTGVSSIVDKSILKSIAEILAHLHAVDWTRHHQALRGSKVWHRSVHVTLHQLTQALVHRWQRFATYNVGTASSAVEAGFAWLRVNVPDREFRPSIVHGDVTFANMLEQDGKLTALLDWEVACLGDPAKDVAHIKPVIERLMPWSKFLRWYVDAGGTPVDAATLRFYEVFKAVTHVAVTYIARGRRFADDPTGRPNLTEIGLNQPQVFLPDLLRAI